MKSTTVTKNEFFAGIHEMVKQFATDDLINLHEIIYIEIAKRKKDEKEMEPTTAKGVIINEI